MTFKNINEKLSNKEGVAEWGEKQKWVSEPLGFAGEQLSERLRSKQAGRKLPKARTEATRTRCPHRN